MSKTVVKNKTVKERVEKLEELNRRMFNKISDLEEEIKELKQLNGGKQPEKKLKIYKTRTDADGERIKEFGCKEIRALASKVDKKGGLTTKQVERFLKQQGTPRNKKTVRRIMRKIATHFKNFKYIKGGSKKNVNGGKKSRLVYTAK